MMLIKNEKPPAGSSHQGIPIGINLAHYSLNQIFVGIVYHFILLIERQYRDEMKVYNLL